MGGAHADLDWSTAIVEDGCLTVGIDGDPSAAWTTRLKAVLERLERAGSPWGKVKVKRTRVRVRDVQPGAESDLRLLLDSAVLQTNSDLREHDDDDERVQHSAQDEAMTTAFRSSAAAGDDDAD
jgi:hypothetical protein